MTRLIVCGASGRMGRRIVALALAQPKRFRIAGAVERKGHPDIGRDAGGLAGGSPIGVRLSAGFDSNFPDGAVVVDFSRADGAVIHAEACRERRIPIVIGATGLSGAQRKRLGFLARSIPVLISPNMSVGVNVLVGLVRQAARRLSSYDAEIVEAHHSQKADAPSGTALRLGEAIAEARGVAFKRAARMDRMGDTGPRRPGEIGIQAVRAGEIVGDHTVLFAGPGEIVEITHRALSRDVFAHGALRAAEWIRGRRAGLYGMEDVLGLR